MPHIDDVIDMIDSYAELLSIAIGLADVMPAEEVPYLPTWRAVRCCRCGLEALQTAGGSVERTNSFTRPVSIGGRWFRPIDLIRHALETIERAADIVEQHQQSQSTPVNSREALNGLADRLYHVEQDLRGLLGPVVAQLSLPHRQQA
ncbi:hypothetical protein [Vreelandella massiliensis]|uniref:hypothetical protein n=1 Tax=Vreelandella massiliensis TaxID=1816686 RepID=UPI00096A9897|nr:hypothetical protein [Halomonas massiliensis]